MTKQTQQTSTTSYRQTLLSGAEETYRQRCYEYLKRKAATDGEAMKALGIKDVNCYRPERTRLYQQGKLERLPKRICTVSSRTCYVWRAKKQ